MKTFSITFAVLFVAFIITRFFAFDLVYHQDEYKWARIVDPQFEMGLESDHPPLVATLYKATGTVFGFDNLRVLPILVSIANLLLVFAIARRMYGNAAALWATALLTVSAYYLIASTMIDIDGALLPFFGLLSVYAYQRLDLERITSKTNHRFLFLLFAASVGGFLIKLSFILFVGAILTDYFFRTRPTIKQMGSGVVFYGAVLVTSSLIVLLLNALLGVEHASRFVENTTRFSFLNIFDRNYTQVLFLTVKSIVLASPLLVVPYVLALSSWTSIKKYRLWLIYGLYNLIFYYVIFDFSNRTIERYLMFIIIPGSIILGSILADTLKGISRTRMVQVFGGTAIVASLVASLIFALPYKIFPLNPKSAYIDAVRNLDFGFLLPITGGSGPTGFYVLVSFVLAFFIAAFALLAVGEVYRGSVKKYMLVAILGLGLVYNVVLIRELSYGTLYGSVNEVTRSIIEKVNADPAIDRVITYYDVGGYELGVTGKYYLRFYTDPIFAAANREKFANYNGYFMVVDFPQIDKESAFWKYFETCRIADMENDGRIYGFIFDCRNGDASHFK